MQTIPKVSVIIPTIKGREEMLARLLSTIPKKYEKIVVPDEELLLAAKRNKGAMQATGKYLLFIDDDNYLERNAIERALQSLDYGVGIVGLTACYDDQKDTIADGGSKRNYLNGFTTGMNTNRKITEVKKNYEVDEVANAFMMPAILFYNLGGFDETRFPIELDEADLCKNVKNHGLKIMMCPKAVCYHKSITYSYIPDFRRPRSAYFMGRNRVLFQRKHLNPFKYFLYLCFYFPTFSILYVLALVYRRKPEMIFHFLKGNIDGLRNRLKNSYQ